MSQDHSAAILVLLNILTLMSAGGNNGVPYIAWIVHLYSENIPIGFETKEKSASHVPVIGTEYCGDQEKFYSVESVYSRNLILAVSRLGLAR